MKKDVSLEKDFEQYKDKLIIVEGKKDVAALKALGFKFIAQIHHGTSLRERTEEIISLSKNKEICVLMDRDKEGRKLSYQINQILQEHGIKIDKSLRRLLNKNGISHIEGLYNFIENN